MNQDQFNKPQKEKLHLVKFARQLFNGVRSINFSKVLEIVHPVRNLILSGINRGRQTKMGLIIMILVPVVIVASIGAVIYFQKGEEVKEAGPAVKVFQQKEGTLGQLEISILKAEEGSYSSFEVIEGEPQRIQKKYYAVYTRVFNPSNTEKVTFSSIKLVDDLGNEYQPDIRILFDLRGLPQGFKEFGRDMVIYPRVIREGNIVFPAIAKEAKILKLIFESETGEQATFEFEK
jgi:hypothetical protein